MDKFSNIELGSIMTPKVDLDSLALPDHKPDANFNAQRLAKALELFKQYKMATAGAGIHKWFIPGTPFGIENCPKHALFFRAGKDYNERLIMAGNRTGKTVCGAYETACHLTGEYPDWWEGRQFDRPVSGWAMGSTARATRDTVQKELIGPIGAWGTGMIPKDKLGQYWALTGVPQGIDIIQVRHKSGGWSRVGFKNYEQPLQAFYGTDLDFVWQDEEVPIELYNECLIRTMTTEGIVYNTFTPLKGLTPMVVQYAEKADFLGGAKKLISVDFGDEDKEDSGDARLADIPSHKAIIQAGWDDAPWLTEEKKAQMLEDTPPHLREARRTGRPALGSGNVYPLDLEYLVCEPFEIPTYYKRLYALDVGWNRTAALFAALDPQTDVLYLYHEYYVGQAEPSSHAMAIRSAAQNWIPGVIDPAARGRSQWDGQQLIKGYRDLGLRVHPAINAVEAGVSSLWHRMAAGKLKVFKTLPNWHKEYTLYRRDLNGKIIKENDHLMDCTRYIDNNLIRAKSLDQVRGGSRMKSGALHYDV